MSVRNAGCAFRVTIYGTNLYFMTELLFQINQLLSSAVLIVSFSLLAYVALQNWRNDVARALSVLLTCLVIVNAGDVLLNRATSPTTIDFLLRFQWIGIALVPAAYIHLADALLTASRGTISHRRPFVWLGYLGSAGVLTLALQTELMVSGGILAGSLAQFGAGPLFGIYVLFVILSGGVALWAILDAYQRALSPTLRRRMTYLGITFAAPGLGVFPYMVIAGAYTSLSAWGILLLSGIVNLAVMVMITIMTYSVAFQGVLLPDRLVKQDFIRWGLYGPVVGIATILFLQIIPWLERTLGVPSTTLLPFGVMIMTVLMPLFVSLAKPYLDALVYLQDREEMAYLRNLPRITFTRTDLRQLLESSLMAICGALQVGTGFVVGRNDEEGGNELGYAVKAVCGSRREVKRFVAEYQLATLIPQIERLPHTNGHIALMPEGSFLAMGNFCLLPLRSPDGVFLGALAIALPLEALQGNGALNSETRRLIGSLSHQIALALTTVQMQQRLFDTLRGLGPEMRSLQELTTRLEQATPATLTALEADVSLHPEFTQLVKDALAHYWGGPKLSDSPLLELRTVRRLIQDQGGSPTRALQAVLRQAIANLRPDEQLDPSAQEWLLYNLLEMRFLQGKPVRDAANRLAMSESDFYRKQRVAIEEVARQLTLMEDSER